MSHNVAKIALVTGANKGSGFEVGKQLAKQEIQTATIRLLSRSRWLSSFARQPRSRRSLEHRTLEVG